MILGADPEVFLIHKGKLKSAIGTVPGTKDTPHNLSFGKIHCDNVAAEFNIIPADTPENFSDNIEIVFQHLKTLVSSKNMSIDTSCCGEFSPKDLRHPYAQLAGCDPDFNAYTGKPNSPPQLSITALRAAGGHIHIGDMLVKRNLHKFIKTMDVFVTIPMLHHEDPVRRLLYGKAGAYREKEYGVEYRTPSNFWIFTAERRKWIFRQTKIALEVFEKIEIPTDTERAINDHNLNRASEIMGIFGLAPCPG